MGRYDQVTKTTASRNLLLGAAVTLAAAAAWFVFDRFQSPAPEPEIKQLALPKQEQQSDAVSQQNLDVEPVAANPDDAAVGDQPEIIETLPTLGESDPAFRQALLAVSPQLTPWLPASAVLKSYLRIVNDFSQGLRLEKHMHFLKPAQPFAVQQTADGLVISEEAYRRYDSLAAAINAIDVNMAVRLYRRYEPLLAEVYDEFGYPTDRPLQDIFLKAAAQILAAPLIEQPIALTRPSVFYKYKDESLEGLSPVAKQMLRMGPGNTRIIQSKVRALVQGLINSNT